MFLNPSRQSTKKTIQSFCRRTRLKQISRAPTAELHTSPVTPSPWCMDDPHRNPLDDLLGLLSDPAALLRPEDRVFTPRPADVATSQDLFRPPSGRRVRAQKGVVDLRDLPQQSLPEVCFVGKSNVGKSSLIKALFYDTTDVKVSVSKKAGHTRTLKFYSIKQRFSLVDMPGYGFNMPKYYTSSVEEYLKTRTNLMQSFLLIDASCGINSTDEVGISMMEEMGRPYTLVLTKIDKNSPQRVLRRLADIQAYRDKHMALCLPQPLLVSSHSRAGLPLLRAFIGYITGNVKIKPH